MRINRVRQWEPWLGNFSDLHREISNALGLGKANPAPASFPQIRVVEEEESLLLEAVVPGFSLEEIEITLHDNNKVTLRGEHKESQADDSIIWHRKERNSGKFSRTLEVSFPIDSARVKAKLEHGVLKLSLPKHESAVARKIPIQTQN